MFNNTFACKGIHCKITFIAILAHLTIPVHDIFMQDTYIL